MIYLGKTPSLFKTIDYTQTIGGKLYLQNILINPVTDLETLHKRQNNLNFFRNIHLDNKYYKQVVEESLKQFKKNESDIFWNIAEKTSEMKEMLKMIYFNNFFFKHINKKELSLTVYYYFIIVFTPFWSLCGPVLFFFLPY